MASGTFTNIKNLNDTGIQTICTDISKKNKENIFVCGSEGCVLKFSKESLIGSDSPSIFNIGDATSGSIAWKDDVICVGYCTTDFVEGTEQKVLGKIVNEDFENPSNLADFQLEITTIDINDTYAVAGSSDFAVKRSTIAGSSKDIKRYDTDAEPVCLKIDPNNEFVAVASIDGMVHIIRLEEFELVTSFKAFPNFGVIDEKNPLIRMSWSIDGKQLFVPSNRHVKAYHRDSWESAENFSANETELNFSTCSVSACGNFLAASTMNNKIIVWRIENRELVSCSQYSRKSPGHTLITSVEFSPFSNDIIVADTNKGICLLQNALGNKSTSGSKKAIEFLNLNLEDDDADSIILSRTRPNFLDDEASMDVDENTRFSSASDDIGAIKKKYGFDNNGMTGLEEYGFNVGAEDVQETKESVSTSNKNGDGTEFPMYEAPRRKLIPERFVCGCSPMEMSQRYLKYNQYGVVRSYVNQQAKTSGIEIEFHNKAIHADIILDNFETNYELADISLNVVALASFESKRKEKQQEKIDDLCLDDNKKEENKGTSELFVIPVSTFESQRWTTTLPRGDGAIDVLVSEEMVVVLTKKRNVRSFTITGLQRQIFTHPGPILTAACFQDRISIASVIGGEFYESDRKKEPQWRFEVTEYYVNNRDWYRYPMNRNSSGARNRIDVPVAAGEQLEWLSYSTKGKLVTMDSAYNVHVLTAPALWMPIFDSQGVLRALSDGIFPIGAVENAKGNEFRYIYCRGTKYPLVSGINAPTSVGWALPYCQPDNERTKNEQELLFNELAQCDAIREGDRNALERLEKFHLAALTKLFAYAVKSDCDGRAVELASLVTSSKGIQLFCNYASKNRKQMLSEKVAELGRKNLERAVEPTIDMFRPTPSRISAVVVNEENEIRPVSRIPLGRKNRKRTREEETQNSAKAQPARKQAKLQFGTGTPKNKKVAVVGESVEKENTPVEEEETQVKKLFTPYDLWFESSEDLLRSEFDGDISDFAKFGIQKFRALSKEQKNKWKELAQQKNKDN
ncbi:unnamed protein product [Caenorhabditis bovis]|uniref:Minichromosome loss protein Mcl1 middle region domain-containing protein n=1 Tax=Caenorhabditis bovis TaxID=2654633 RepID=A0A8S1EAU4_9PELO|nr:unnamed protein product [Caenorhabditis bovis]